MQSPMSRKARGTSFRLDRARRNAIQDRGSASGRATGRSWCSGVPPYAHTGHRVGKRLGKVGAGSIFSSTSPYRQPSNGQSIHQTGPAGGTYTQQSGGQLKNGLLFQMYALRSDLCSAAQRVRSLRSRRPLLRIADYICRQKRWLPDRRPIVPGPPGHLRALPSR